MLLQNKMRHNKTMHHQCYHKR